MGDVGVWREPSGQANGLTLDDKGQLIACEHGRRRVSRTLPDGRVVPAADSYQDYKFNSPQRCGCPLGWDDLLHGSTLRD